MVKAKVNIAEHFSKYSSVYHDAVKNANKELYENIRTVLNQNLKGVVLDIGNGGVFAYDVNKLTQVIAVDLGFDNSIHDTEKIKYLVGNACDLIKINSDSVDCVLMQFLLHHIVGKNRNETDCLIRLSLKEAQRVLKPKGKLIIIEIAVHPFFEYVEDILYNINHFLLSLVNRPMVKFYSKKGLLSKLRSAGFEQLMINKINIGKWCDPLSALFPGVIKMPAYLYPARHYSITALKSEINDT